MAAEWMTYAHAGQRLGISPEAVRQKAIRQHWPRRRANDGRTHVQADIDEVLAAVPPREPRAEQPADDRPTDDQTPERPGVGHPADERTVDALNDHIATLRTMIAHAERLVDVERARTDAERLRADSERARADNLASQLERLRTDGDDRAVAFEHRLAELRGLVDDLAARSWWRRLASGGR